MNKFKMKNWQFEEKRRLLISILLTCFLSFMITNIYIKSLSKNMTTYIGASVKKKNILLLKEAFTETSATFKNVDDLILVTQNSKEEIIQVDFDMQMSSNLLSSITDYINATLNEYNYLGYRIDLPVGLLSKNPIFANIGPKIPVKVELSDVALGNVRTTVKPFGINNALVEVYLDIFIRTSVLYPFEVLEVDSEFSSLVSSKIIQGTVPNFWGGSINSKSDTIDLPLNE